MMLSSISATPTIFSTPITSPTTACIPTTAHPVSFTSPCLQLFAPSLLPPTSHESFQPAHISSSQPGLVIFFFRPSPRDSSLTRLLGFILLLLLAGPSAVRWLDDGMETGLVLCVVAILCWVTFRQFIQRTITPPRYLAFVVVGFVAVLLRTELILLCGLSFAILSWKALFDPEPEPQTNRRINAVISVSHLLVGGRPCDSVYPAQDARLFTRHRPRKILWRSKLQGTIRVTEKVLSSSLSFGVGIFFFWLLTLILFLRTDRLSIPNLFANLAFPILFSLAALRGQQVQGARYFVWTLFFSILWNILQLSRIAPHESSQPQSKTIAYCFMAPPPAGIAI